MTEGEQKAFFITFANIGQSDLIIDLATACKCTQIEWPREPVPPEYSSQIYLVFDSTGYEGEVVKVVDIISNTESIVTEAWFRATVVPKDD